MCTGRQYVHRFMDKLDINHRAETGGGATEGRMYELSVFVYKTISKFDRQHDLPFHNYTSNLNTDLNDSGRDPGMSFINRMESGI